MHHALPALVVVHRVVLDAAVVPQRERPDLPAEPARELGLHLVLEEEAQQRPALLLGHPVEAGCMGHVDVEGTASGLGMDADDRVHRLVLLRLDGVAVDVADAVLAGLADVGHGRAVHGAQRFEQRLHRRRQRLVGGVLAGVERVAAEGRELTGQQHRGHRRSVEVRGVGVPDAPEVRGLVGQLRDGDDVRVPVDPRHERVPGDRADALGEGEELVGAELLIAEEHHAVVQPGLAHIGQDLVADGGEVDPTELRTHRAGDRSDAERRVRTSLSHGDNLTSVQWIAVQPHGKQPEGSAMSDWKTIDYFGDERLLEDPYDYYDQLRDECPVLMLEHHGVVAVTGYDEINEVYRDTDSFSSCNSVVGPYATFPVPLEGDDIGSLIAEHRDKLPMFEHMVTMDPPDHTRERALLMRLITPKRLKDNEAFMWGLADQQLDEFLANGSCEFISEYAQPFAMLAVADLLGVPDEDHRRFRAGFGLKKSPGQVGQAPGPDVEAPKELNSLSWLDSEFAAYIEDRRANPRKDVLTDLALATYPDDTVPEVLEVVRTATFLFAAGQETTARLLAAALKQLAEHPELQDQLRANKELIPTFVEESLRLESPVKTDFRLTKRTTKIGELEVQAGTPVMLLNGAANRDPRRFECPHEFQVDRANAQSHIAFGRGVHSCPGGPLARAEGRISIERILDRTRDIRLSEEHHGPKGARTFAYEPTWILRGLNNLHLEFTPYDEGSP